MKYFIDTEFIEGFHQPLFGKRRHFVDLISIGIVAEDGRTYYAISKEFNPKDADDWVKKNVIEKLSEKPHPQNGLPEYSHWKSNKQIAFDIFRFVHHPVIKKWDDKISLAEEIVKSAYEQGEEKHEFYAYYADYDWVVFCSLFGRMIDLPKGFPMYCLDLKQTFDEKVDKIFNGQNIGLTALEILEIRQTTGDLIIQQPKPSKKQISDAIKASPDYPKQENEHNALDDAKWNKKLYEFLKWRYI